MDPRDDHAPPNNDPLVTVGKYDTPAEAQWARNVLASAGICALLPESEMGRIFSVLHRAVYDPKHGGIRLQVKAEHEEAAREILAKTPYERMGYEECERRRAEARRCGECGSEDLAAVPRAESVSGGFELRCVECGVRHPVDDATYHDDAFPLLPSSCPKCGSHRLHQTEPPAEALNRGDWQDRQWLRCDDCTHEWEIADLVKEGAPKAAEAPGSDADGSPEAVEEFIRCPRCGSDEVAEDIHRDPDDDVLRLHCARCYHEWEMDLNGDGSAQPDGPEGPPITPEEACPLPHLMGGTCPSCGGSDVSECETPEYAVQSIFVSFLKKFTGSGWRRCNACGHMWET